MQCVYNGVCGGDILPVDGRYMVQSKCQSLYIVDTLYSLDCLYSFIARCVYNYLFFLIYYIHACTKSPARLSSLLLHHVLEKEDL